MHLSTPSLSSKVLLNELLHEIFHVLTVDEFF
jgi:hypothetical protein